MRVAFISDIHMDMYRHMTTGFLYDASWDVLVVAGDTGSASQMMALLEDVADNCPHNHIIAVTGNHEYYDNGETVQQTDQRIREWLENIPNVSVLMHGEHVVIDGVSFVGATLWSDIANELGADKKLAAEFAAQNTINDFVYINAPNGGITVNEMRDLFYMDREGIIESLLVTENPTKTVVITHFSPTIDYRNTDFRIGPLSYYFSGTMDGVIRTFEPAVWISGHTHSNIDELEYGNTMLRSNQYHLGGLRLKYFDI